MVQMDETIAALNNLDVDARYYDTHEDIPLDIDIVHLLHCNFPWACENILRAGKRHIVTTPIFYPTIGHSEAKAILSCSRAVLPFSNAEAVEIEQLGIKLRTVWPIPNATSRRFHAADYSTFSSSRTGVITTCARPGEKNSDKIVQTCAELKIPCKVVCGVPYEGIHNVYSAAKVFVNASDSERMSLSIGEALCAGCRVLATKDNRGNEWYGEGLVTFSPQESFKVLLDYAYNTIDAWDYRPNYKARQLTWDGVASALVDVYKHVLQGR